MNALWEKEKQINIRIDNIVEYLSWLGTTTLRTHVHLVMAHGPSRPTTRTSLDPRLLLVQLLLWPTACNGLALISNHCPRLLLVRPLPDPQLVLVLPMVHPGLAYDQQPVLGEPVMAYKERERESERERV